MAGVSLPACSKERGASRGSALHAWAGAFVRLLSDGCSGALRAAFESGVRKVTQGLQHVTTEVLDEVDWKRFDSAGRLFWNMNTAADYEEARRILEAERT